MVSQMDKVTYVTSLIFATKAVEDLAEALVKGTNGVMDRVYIVNSGSEAMEAALKLARQYFLELDPPQPKRVRFISRGQSYHGITLGALSVSGHTARRAPFEPLLMSEGNWSTVSPCNVYRGKKERESDEEYVARLAKELDDEFTRVGPENVIAFIAESVSGAVRTCPSLSFLYPDK